MTKIIGRFTNPTLLGEEMAHGAEYVDIIIQHAGIPFPAAMQLLSWPRYLWAIVQYFAPVCAKVRCQVLKARKSVTKELDRREMVARATIVAGPKVPKTHDSVA